MELKLVIWDLDDTFWDGTLSEGEIKLDEKKIALVKHLVDRGVMNSICSKNDYENVKRILEPAGLWDYFVFPSIDWTPKAPRIEGIIKTMALRPVNVLFIDDNPINLNEARYYLPELNVLDVKDIDSLIAESVNIGKDDSAHKRLKQYHLMETKVSDSKNFVSTNAFLEQSEIVVTVNRDCLPLADRIAEMVVRTNQLNYTKLRSTKDEILQTLNDSEYECATVSVKDKYGDYGIVGFYALHRPTAKLKHFLFSCRTLGMGIEQYIYETLEYPALEVVGEVANPVEKRKIATWINNSTTSAPEPTQQAKRKIGNRPRVLLKGPCDLDSVIQYLGNQDNFDVDTEFNFNNLAGIAITAMNHSAVIVESQSLTDAQKDKMLSDAPFVDRSIFDQKILDKDYDYVVMSMLPDCHEGVYRHKATGGIITFSSANFDLTNPDNWEKFISGEYPNHNYAFTREVLENFARAYTFEGFADANTIVENVMHIRQKLLPRHTRLILVLGSEMECAASLTGEFDNHAANHARVNAMLKDAMSKVPNVTFIETTDLIHSQSDYNGCINHYSRNIYYQLAKEISQIINSQSDSGDFRVTSRAMFVCQGIYLSIKSICLGALRRVTRR
jgi:FkbH-like protein